jgi:16S rRNA (adenine1518-N6/adenine1519-N6)-dimethyltransferase
MRRKPQNAPFAKKSFGQNFLTDQNFINRIVSAADLSADDVVVEIGPGRGALTEHLVERSGQIIAVELDRDLARPLRDKFTENENFRLVEADAVELRFADVIAKYEKPAKLIANLPFNVSTAILQSLAGQKALFSQMVLMFQREVTERITAAPSTSDRGFLTVLVEANFGIERLFDVPPTAFRPVPKVWSSVVRLTPKFVDIPDEILFRNLISVGFAQRRKTIQNNLKTQFPDAQKLLEQSDIHPTRRAETLTLDEWLALTRSCSEATA